MRPMSYFSGFLLLVYLFSGWLQASENGYQPVQSLAAGTSPRGIAVGNVFGNGTPSLLVANFGSSTFIGKNTPATLLTAQNSMVQVFSPSPDGLQLTSTIPTAPSPRDISLFDLSNKNRQDILVTAYDANLLQIFSWIHGQFVKTSEAQTQNLPVGVTAGLTRPGGVPFVVAANYGSNSLSLFQVRDGKLLKRFDIPVDNGPTQVVIGQFNRDPNNEIVAVCLPANKIDFLSKGPGGLDDDLSSYSVTKSLSLSNGGAPADLRAVDLNGDGRTDLVVGDFSKNAITVFLQSKDGSLIAQPPVSTSGSHPNGLTVADLNGDGGKEILVANRDSDSLDIFGTAGGQFQLFKTLKVGEDTNGAFGPVEVGVLDTKTIGKMDIVTSHMRSNTIRVLERVVAETPTPTGTPAPAGEAVTPFSDKTTFCYPNPSHDGKVRFSFTLDSPSAATIQIFDIRGEAVWSRKLSPSQTQSGINSLSWDGVNQMGGSLASGVYLYSITVGEATITKKVAIIH